MLLYALGRDGLTTICWSDWPDSSTTCIMLSLEPGGDLPSPFEVDTVF